MQLISDSDTNSTQSAHNARFSLPWGMRFLTLAGLVGLAMLTAGCRGSASEAAPLHERESRPMILQDTTPFADSMTALIGSLESAHDCRIGVSLRDTATSATLYSHRGSELFHSASTMKIAVMVEVFRQAEQGRFRLDEQVPLNTTFHSMIDDSPYEVEAAKYLRPRVGGTASILELTEQMMVVSDNLATNLLLTRVRSQRVTATLRELGVKDGFVLRCLMDIPAYEAGVSNRLSPEGLTTLLEAIDKGAAAGPESTAEMRRILLAQEYRDMIPAGIPSGILVGNKTGSITAVAHDAAVVYDPAGHFYLAIMMDGLAPGKRGADIAPIITRHLFEERKKLLAGQ